MVPSLTRPHDICVPFTSTRQADRAVDVATEGRNASGLRMPMYCSSARETVDHKEERALAVDVVFHPWVIRSCRGERRFQDQVHCITIFFELYYTRCLQVAFVLYEYRVG